MATVTMFPTQKGPSPKREAERLKTLAESLREGGKYKGNEMVSGLVVKQSPLEHLARGLQTAGAGYFEGQSRLKEDQDEQMMQQRLGEALNAWGENPQAAAAILAQDPRTSDMAMRLMMGETDYQRQKELAQMRISALGGGGGNLPAPMKIANQMFELEQVMNNPNTPEGERFLAERQYNLLGQAAKTYGFDRGFQSGPVPGYDQVFSAQNPVPAEPISPEMLNQPMPQMGPNLPPPAPGQLQDIITQPLPPQDMNDPMARNMMAVKQQQQQIGVSPAQRPDMVAPQVSAIPGYDEALATREGKVEAGKMRAKYMEEGFQRLPKAQRALQDAEIRNQNIVRVAQQAAQSAQGAFTTGFTGSILGAVAGTPAFDLKNNLQTLEATAAFGTLQDMRDNSPTGGALGNVTERELDLLKAAYSNLANSQSYEQFMQNLEAFNIQNQKSLQNARAAYEQDYQRFGGASDQFLPAPNAQPQQKKPRIAVNPQTGERLIEGPNGWEPYNGQ